MHASTTEFPSTDLVATKTFYSGVFGWEFTDYGPDYTSFNDGRLTGGFYRGPAGQQGTSTLAVIFAVDLESMLSEIEGAGGKIAKPIFVFPGGRRFHFRDPSGNELAVWTDRKEKNP